MAPNQAAGLVQNADDEVAISVVNAARNSLPTVPARSNVMFNDLLTRVSLQHIHYANTHYQSYQSTNLSPPSITANRFGDQPIDKASSVNKFSRTSAQDSHQFFNQPQSQNGTSHLATSATVADSSNLVDSNTQDKCTEEIIQAILTAKEALEKPIEERDEQDIKLIDYLCSLVHGFDAFPESIRRALAAQAVLIVIDEKGKELIVHNEELDSFCVLIFGLCEQLDVTKTRTIRQYNVGDAFGVVEPTTEVLRFDGHMITKCENCAFLCVKSDEFYTILTDPANYPNKETLRYRDRDGNIICVSQFDPSKKSTGSLWSYQMQSRPFKLLLPDGHVIVKVSIK